VSPSKLSLLGEDHPRLRGDHRGALLAISKTAAIVDGNVVAIAIALRPATIVTSDVHDVTHLLESAKIPHAVFGARVFAAAQVIIVRI